MRKVWFPLTFFLSALFFLLACTDSLKDKLGAIAQDISGPFNYNKRSTYIFSVKATGADNSTLYRDTLGLMCTNKIWSIDSFQKTISWVYLTKPNAGPYTINPAKINNSFTGMSSTNEELFIHPPRVDCYTILEICPYPFLHFPLFVGKKWDWDLMVNRKYSPINSIKWMGDENFKSVYEVTDTVILKIPTGKTLCYRVHATNTSKLGMSSADFYYS